MTEIKVSVITTFTQLDDWLIDCITSVSKSRFKEVEHILVYDGTLYTQKEIFSFIPEIKNIKVILAGKVGRANALNIAVNSSIGKYCAVLDSDDLMYSERIGVQIKFLENSNFKLCFSNVEFIDEDGKFLKTSDYETDPLFVHKMLYDLNPFCHSSVMFCRNTIQEIGGYPTIFKKSIDFNMYLLLLRSGYSIGGIRDPLVKIRLHQYSWGQKDLVNLQYIYAFVGMLDPVFQKILPVDKSISEQHRKKYIYMIFKSSGFYEKVFISKLLARAKPLEQKKKLLGYTFIFSYTLMSFMLKLPVYLKIRHKGLKEYFIDRVKKDFKF